MRAGGMDIGPACNGWWRPAACHISKFGGTTKVLQISLHTPDYLCSQKRSDMLGLTLPGIVFPDACPKDFALQ